MLIDNEVKLDFDDVLIVPQSTEENTRSGVSLEREFKFFHSPRTWTGFPVMAANMYATGSFNMGEALWNSKAICCLHKHHDIDKMVDFFELPDFNPEFTRRFIVAYQQHCWISTGIKDKDYEYIIDLHKRLGRQLNICIDVANGYASKFHDFCKRVREACPDSIIMAGNICTPEMVLHLIKNCGVDIVKVGIGPGSVCTTRLVAGVGYPQLSAIIDCGHAAHGLLSGEGRLGLICADGGCTTIGDINKAFCANADFVMLGGMFAGVDECDGEWEYHPRDQYRYKDPTSSIWGTQCFHEGGICGFNASDGSLSIVTSDKSKHEQYTTEAVKKSLKFYGMSSKEAQDNHNGGMDSYKASEGRSVTVSAKGPVKGIIEEIQGGVRSCCSYIGANSLRKMSRCAKFVRVNNTHNRSMENRE
jgi:GMP reductase